MSRKRLDLTLAFLRSLDRTASAQDVSELLLRLLGRFGIEHALAGTLPVVGAKPRQQYEHALLDAMPADWKTRYLSRGYLFRDATVRHLGGANAPFAWSEIAEQYREDPAALQVMHEAGEHGLRHGVTVPLLTLDGQLAGFSFSGARVEVSPEDLGTLQLVATYAFAQLVLLRSEAGAEIRLSPREREVLQWVAEGKTSWEIGEILAISSKGVEHHLRTTRTKLGTLNSAQSVAVALRRGLIS
ncbi:autoinducer binding domain-containing protein [Methylobacterium sp. 17Sr1-1]|uniref:autoinducer binding domain-containing protein n=1 Tax=Methylobacterium sp. 17Sr1-1 TaxID=2202826 RepID=UPI000D704723|nr:autoinducer binding domain-containing protein [Methylobacterium sp. 17Sr1-1]AWN54544.1 autoinducer-binding protein [Methylobacterium sp. 17Sr1-1]